MLVELLELRAGEGGRDELGDVRELYPFLLLTSGVPPTHGFVSPFREADLDIDKCADGGYIEGEGYGEW